MAGTIENISISTRGCEDWRGMASQEAVCLGQSWAGIRSLTSGPGSSHSGNTGLGASPTQEASPRFSPRPRRGRRGRRQGSRIHSPAWDAASEPLGCCICNHGNSTGRKGSGPGLATRPPSQAQLTTLACFLCKERWREHPRVASRRADLPCQLSGSGRGGRAAEQRREKPGSRGERPPSWKAGSRGHVNSWLYGWGN